MPGSMHIAPIPDDPWISGIAAAIGIFLILRALSQRTSR